MWNIWHKRKISWVHFTDRDWLRFERGWIITCIFSCGTQLFINYLISTVGPLLRLGHGWKKYIHYNDVIMGAIVSQITSLTIANSTAYSDADQRKHQSSVSLAFVRGIHRGPGTSPHKGPVTRKVFPFDDVIISSFCVGAITYPYHNPNVASAKARSLRGTDAYPAGSNKITGKGKWRLTQFHEKQTSSSEIYLKTLLVVYNNWNIMVSLKLLKKLNK